MRTGSYLGDSTHDSTRVPSHRLHLTNQLISTLMVSINLRNKIILLIRTPHRQSLHRVLPQQAFDARLGNESMRGTGKQEFLTRIREDAIPLHREHLGEGGECVGVESAEGMRDAHFHVDRNHGRGYHGSEKGRDFVHQERSEEEHRPARLVAVDAVRQGVKRGRDEFFDEDFLVALIKSS